MKKNLVIFSAVVTGMLCFALYSLHAQTNSPSGAAVPTSGGQVPPPGAHFQQNLRPLNNSGRLYHSTIMMLNHVRDDLNRNASDLNGHRQSALDAVNKAISELQAVEIASRPHVTNAVPSSAVSPPGH